MKTSIFGLAVFCLVLPFANLSADDKSPDTCDGAKKCQMKGAWKKHHAMKIADRMIQKFDMNGDGALDKMELAKMIEAHINHWKTGSTVPKTAQVAPSPSLKATARAEKMLKKFDKDADGKLDRKELSAMIRCHFARCKQKGDKG